MSNTYLTENPLGSTAVKDLYDNASNFDDTMNSQSPAFTDRFLRRRQTWFGMETMFAEFLANSGFESVHLVYVDGTPLDVLRPTQLIDRAGISYRVKLPASFPVTLTGNWATDQLLLLDVADASLRQDLANVASPALGAAMIGRGAQVVNSIAELRLLDSTKPSKNAFATDYYGDGAGGGGPYRVDLTDITSPDNGGSVIVAADGARWKLIYDRSVDVRQFGAKSDGSDAAPAINAAIVSVGLGGEVRIPKGSFTCMSPVLIPAVAGTFSTVSLVGVRGGSELVAGAIMSTLIDAPSKLVTITGLQLTNPGGVAAVGIRSITDSGDAAFSLTADSNLIVGFSSGIQISGQNYTLQNNFLQNCTVDFDIIDDGRNSVIDKNYTLGGSIGVRASRVTHQAEGLRITNNTFLKTVGNGAAVSLDAGLEILIAFNVFDQIGPNSPAIYLAAGVGNAIAKIKMYGNWMAAGQNSYSLFCSGNCANIIVDGCTIVSNNGLNASAGIAMTGVNGYQLSNNDFSIVGGPDLDIVGSARGNRLGNLSNRGNSNAVANILYADLSVPELTYNVCSLSSGNGAPAFVRANGSIYSRLDGGVGARLYISNGGSWTPVPGV